MPRTQEMTPDHAGNRWKKKHRRKVHTIGLKELGFLPGQFAASQRAANEWWRQKRAELDGAFGQLAASARSMVDSFMVQAMRSAIMQTMVQCGIHNASHAPTEEQRRAIIEQVQERSTQA